MAAHRGNSSKYERSLFDDRFLPAVEQSDLGLAIDWGRARLRDPMVGLHERARAFDTKGITLNCAELLHILEYMHIATGLDYFEKAAESMRHLGITKGGLVQRTRFVVAARSSEQIAVRRMASWIESEGYSVSKAAKLALAETGLPPRDGDDTALNELRMALGKLHQRRRHFPDEGPRRSQQFHDETLSTAARLLLPQFLTLAKHLEELYRKNRSCQVAEKT